MAKDSKGHGSDSRGMVAKAFKNHPGYQAMTPGQRSSFARKLNKAVSEHLQSENQRLGHGPRAGGRDDAGGYGPRAGGISATTQNKKY